MSATYARSVASEIKGLRESARDALARGKDKAIELEEGLESTIRDHPLRSILIALGVGAVVGAWMSRR